MTIPVMHCFDNNYVLPAAVSFYSMLSHADKNHDYRLYVLHSDISESNQKRLKEVVSRFPNAQLEFIDMSNRFESLWKDFIHKDHLAKEVLYKLIVPSIFPQYDRMIITDVDVVFMDDISDSYFALDGHENAYFAGVRQIKIRDSFLWDYYEGYRRVFGDEGYESLKVCGGYLVANLRKMREDNAEEVFVAFLKKYAPQLMQAEQDVINFCCREEQICLLPLRYVVCSYMYDICEGDLAACATDPHYSFTDIRHALEHPVQLHYATKIKPWMEPESSKSDIWYEYLKKVGAGFEEDCCALRSMQKRDNLDFSGQKRFPLDDNRTYPVTVSVICCCYCQEKYIAKTLESILTQKTKYTFEVIVADDASHDRTQSIIASFQEQYPDQMKKCILRTGNVGIGKNYYEALSLAEGKYVAICDGDDFWNDTHKIEKQVDFLESHPDYSMVCSNFIMHSDDENGPADSVFNVQTSMHTAKNSFGFQEYLTGRFIGSCTVMMRWRLHGCVPKFLQHHNVIDFPLELIHASCGRIYAFKEEFSTYNIHASSISHSDPRKITKEISIILKETRQLLGDEYSEIIGNFLDSLREIRKQQKRTRLPKEYKGILKTLNDAYHRIVPYRVRIRIYNFIHGID